MIAEKKYGNLSKTINLSEEIPTEDIDIFLTAKFGLADCFVSANRKLLKAIADTNLIKCGQRNVSLRDHFV